MPDLDHTPEPAGDESPSEDPEPMVDLEDLHRLRRYYDPGEIGVTTSDEDGVW